MEADENDIIFITHGLGADFFERLFNLLPLGGLSFDASVQFLSSIWFAYSILAFFLSALFIFGIIYSYIRLGQLKEIEEEHLHEEEKIWKELHGGHIEDQRWRDAQTHLESENPNDWKLAIIEADVLLERMLEKAGYVGTTVGEKLQNASARSFATLDDAWRAHRVRNQIAHGGADFVLTQKLARETLVLYERVFREFDVV